MSSLRRAKKEFQEKINNSIHDFADCSICGYCCKDEALDIFESDAYRISRNLKIDKKKFYEKYTHFNEITKAISMNMPCPFLKENRCTIYNIRPEKCRNYPIFVLEKGTVWISEAEACALATHFREAFLDYLSKNLPEYYKRAIKSYDEAEYEPGKILNAEYSWKEIYDFIKWLNSDKEC